MKTVHLDRAGFWHVCHWDEGAGLYVQPQDPLHIGDWIRAAWAPSLAFLPGPVYRDEGAARKEARRIYGPRGTGHE